MSHSLNIRGVRAKRHKEWPAHRPPPLRAAFHCQYRDRVTGCKTKSMHSPGVRDCKPRANWWIDPNPPTPLPALGQTPARESDKRRLAIRTEADTEGKREGLPCWKQENTCTKGWKDEGNGRHDGRIGDEFVPSRCHGILGPGSTSGMFIKLLRTRGKEEEDENINDYFNGLVWF